MFSFFFFNDTATTEIYPLSLHDALPISVGGLQARNLGRFLGDPGARAGDRGRDESRRPGCPRGRARQAPPPGARPRRPARRRDRKSTRLNSSHGYISYAVFCLKKKTKIK